LATVTPPELPDWYPPWARQLAGAYLAGTSCVFLMHGNVRDLYPGPDDGAARYLHLAEFLAAQVFGSWDVVLHYDLGRGLRALPGPDPQRLSAMMQYLSGRIGDPASWPRDPESALLALDRLLERNLLEPDPERRKKIAIILDYAQYLAPEGDIGSLSHAQGAALIRLLGWAQNPYLKRVNVAVCLAADRLTEVNHRLAQSAHVTAVEVPLPDDAERERFVRHAEPAPAVPPGELAKLTNGLSLVNVQALLAQVRGGADEVRDRFKRLKKTLIERQCQGLVEFVEPGHTLDLVVGLTAAKERLRQDAELLSRGRLDAAPMGYLICGPVGTGKTFLAECYAGSVGIPCVKLRNFRSKYVGETEGNLEQVLTVLRSLGPVVVLIDEADASLGTREADGDSGTSSRVFAMIASQMGDTRYRGRIVWMLLTSRPELLPIDLKRQGRAEVHIPLFYPQDEGEVREMFLAMARKNKVKLAEKALPKVKAQRHLSGSDIESVVLSARRRALAAGREEVTKDDLQQAWTEFIPSAQGLEKERQELAAVLECTELSFLPPDWREQVSAPDGRAKLQERLRALTVLLKD
jgi:SpoVK/Ycf46/Vps4 family AAA+-type ATPase